MRLDGKHMIVTGGASGLGAETVRALSTAGARATIATRNPAIGASLAAELQGVDTAELNLTDPASVRRFAARWEGPVHALVANAGLMAVSTRELNPAGWELQQATNFLAHLANGLHKSLQAAGPARVVVVSSGVQLRSPVNLDDVDSERRSYDPRVACAQSKTAGVLLAVAISRHRASEKITGNALPPGFFHTDPQRRVTPEAMGGMDENGNLLRPEYDQTLEQGAAQQSEAVPRGSDSQHGVAGWSVDPVTAGRLWDVALQTLRPAPLAWRT